MHSDNFKPPSYLGEIPWAASSSLNHKVPLRAACESAHTLGTFLHFILRANKEDTVQVFHNGGKMEKHIYSRTNDGMSDENEWGDDLRGAIFLISSMHL